MFIIQEGTLDNSYSIIEVDDPRYIYGYATLQLAQQALLRITTEVNCDDTGVNTAHQSNWARAANEKILEERAKSNKSVTRSYRLKK